MKRMKWAAVCVALAAMAGFTSCLDNDDDGTRSGYGYYRVVNSYYGTTYFEDIYGYKYIPTASFLSTSSSELAYILFSYNQNDMTQGAKELDITLEGEPVYLERLGFNSTALPAEDKTVSITSLNASSGGIWGNNEFLILMPTLMLKSSTTEENLSSELANHRLTLYYVPGEDTDSKTLTLHLRYTIDGIESSDEESSTDEWEKDYNISYNYPAYVNISQAISAYNSAGNVGNPEKIVIEYEKGSPTMDPEKKTSETAPYNWLTQTSATS